MTDGQHVSRFLVLLAETYESGTLPDRRITPAQLRSYATIAGALGNVTPILPARVVRARMRPDEFARGGDL